MLHTSRQLKALVRNMSKGDSNKAQIIIRKYIMERFLERIVLSPYRDNLILKGGTLISAMVGLDNRSTMDVDSAVQNMLLSEESARMIVKEIISVHIEDGVSFAITSVDTIMNEADYSGVRVILDTVLESMRTPLKLDFSTGDVITPREVAYSFRLMFEERTISILAYNLETVLAEKLETLLSRSTANTRMRDFYDIYILAITQPQNINDAILCEAYTNTCRNRDSTISIDEVTTIINEVETSPELIALWKNYQRKFDYAAEIKWEDVMGSVKKLCEIAISNELS